MGDLVLCSSALETSAASADAENHWLVAEEFASLLEGHPKVAHLWRYNRKSGGLGAWLKLSRALYDEKFDEVVDLHRSLRSKLLVLCFRFWSLLGIRRAIQFRSLSKGRFSLWGYFWFKSLFPRALRPKSLTVRAALAAGGTGNERPDLTHLVKMSGPLEALGAPKARYFCVMAGAQWEGKRLAAEKYVEVCLRQKALVPVVLGGPNDFEAIRLFEMLKVSGLSPVNGVGRWKLPEVAAVLHSAEFYLGNDTGLAHLAEAVGTAAHIVFGPTVPDMGFGPWRPESRSYGSKLFCRPCGKDGRYCFRGTKYLCLKKLDTSQILSAAGAPKRDAGERRESP